MRPDKGFIYNKKCQSWGETLKFAQQTSCFIYFPKYYF